VSSLGQDLRAALRAFAALPRVLVAVDFDGTLAPLVTDPLQARALPDGLEALREAAALPGVTTAVVSGRDLDTLATLTGIEANDGITLVGSHGAQSNRPGAGLSGSTGGGAGLDDSATQLMGALGDELKEIWVRCPAVRLEHKPTAVVLHTRGVDRSMAEAATAAALEVGARHAGVQVIRGKEVVELSVSPADKGTALTDLALASRSDATLYLGDDTTDERAFAALDPSSGDLTVKVGRGKSVALHRVPDPAAVVELLRLFVDARRG
jgi:trehalose 6-phosphate phosphatase